MQEKVSNNNTELKFILDEQVVEINFELSSAYKPTTTLLQYLRSLPNHKGVKEGCAEGDCGACTVVICSVDNKGKVTYQAIDSCLVFLPMIHGKIVLTVENIGSSNKLHPVQEAMVDKNGSQCGFCTPGIVMSLFSMQKNEKQFTKELTLDYLSGNLCRCTGYSSILKAAEVLPFADEEINFCDQVKMLDLINSIDVLNTLQFEKNGQLYIKVFSLKEALAYKKKYPEAIVVNGSTDIALKVTKQKQFLPLILDISDIAELKQVDFHENTITIGAGLNLDKVKDISQEYLPALHSILKVFGSKQIRNLSTLGGNLGSASPIGDTIPVLMAYNAKLVLQDSENERIINVREFITGYRKTLMKSDELITKIVIDKLPKDEIVKSYKISKRKDLDISSVSGGFYLKLDKKNIILDLCLAYGGMAATPQRAGLTEGKLKGQTWSKENVMAASLSINDDFNPITDARSGKEARAIMARNLLIKFWSETS